MSECRTIVDLLEKVINDQIDPKEALAQWPDTDAQKNSLNLAAWHELSHYTNDWDIRAKDKEYEVIQKDRLRGYAQEIKEAL